MTEEIHIRPICDRAYIYAWITGALIQDATWGDVRKMLFDNMRKQLDEFARKHGYALHPDAAVLYKQRPAYMRTDQERELWRDEDEQWFAYAWVFEKRLVDITVACDTIEHIRQHPNGFDPLLDMVGHMDWVSELHRLVHGCDHANNREYCDIGRPCAVCHNRGGK